MRSFCSAGAISNAGYRPSPGIDSKAATSGAMSFASNPERVIIASSLSSLAGAGSALAKPAAGRVADDRLFLRRALADEVADHDDPSRDANARLERVLRVRFKLVEAVGTDAPHGLNASGKPGS